MSCKPRLKVVSQSIRHSGYETKAHKTTDEHFPPFSNLDVPEDDNRRDSQA